MRRSISQPLDLDKSLDTPSKGPFSSCLNSSRENHGHFQHQRSLDHTPSKRQRRPSAGNILNEDTTSEDDAGLSDSEDFQRDLKRSLEQVRYF